MNTKTLKYEKPLTEVVELETEGVIANSIKVQGEIIDEGFGSRRRDFWE